MSMRKIYREIAKKHGVSIADVKRDMQAAIDAAYIKPNRHALEVSRRGDKPTPEEFIAYMAHKASDKKGNS